MFANSEILVGAEAQLINNEVGIYIWVGKLKNLEKIYLMLWLAAITFEKVGRDVVMWNDGVQWRRLPSGPIYIG